MVSLNRSKVTRDFGVLTRALGLDEVDLLAYLNWCLLEHLVTALSSNKEWINELKLSRDGMAKFRKEVERRTNYVWDVENIRTLYDRVRQATETHYRKPILYEDLLRLLINNPLKCANESCGKAPPEVRLHIDHIFAASRGGDSKFENLRFLCEQCNLKKSDKLIRSSIWIKLESLRPS
jgi:hypothetical protein